MNCPHCENQKLTASKYANANVRECSTCYGFLLDQTRAESVKRRIDKNTAQLKREVERSALIDTVKAIRCPACRNRMKKTFLKKLHFHVDECDQCGKSWFDGGELPLLQLAFETRPQRIEINRMRERLRNMTEAEREQYEKNILALKDQGTQFEQVVLGAACELTRLRYWR